MEWNSKLIHALRLHPSAQEDDYADFHYFILSDYDYSATIQIFPPDIDNRVIIREFDLVTDTLVHTEDYTYEEAYHKLNELLELESV